MGAVHMTVAVTGAGAALDLRHETQLVKAALLYADHVTLASPKALLLADVAALGTGDRQARIGQFVELIEQVGDNDAVRVYRELDRRRGSLSPRDLLSLHAIESGLETASQGLGARADQIVQDANVDELADAISAGLVDVHRLGYENADVDSFVDVILKEMAALLEASVSSSAQAFPLFDDGAGDLLRAMVKEGKVVDPQLQRATEAGIAGRLIGSLEAFPNAEMDVVLDVRAKLQVPLVRFRSALAQFSGEIAAAAWDEVFPQEIDDLYRREVAPALLDVKQALDELAAVPTLLRLTRDKRAQAAATLGLVAAGGVAPVDLPALLYSAPAIGAAAAGVDEVSQRREIHRSSESNAFYFLYESNRQLDR